MKTGSGKRIALVTVAVGLVLLIATGFAFRGRILEEYWLHRLEHGDERGRKVAAERLGEMRSVRAVRPLLAWLRAKPAEQHSSNHGGLVYWVVGQTPPSLALTRIGAAAVPGLVDCLSASDDHVREAALSILERIGHDAGAALPHLRRMLEEPGEIWRSRAILAITRIDPDWSESRPLIEAAVRDLDPVDLVNLLVEFWNTEPLRADCPR